MQKHRRHPRTDRGGKPLRKGDVVRIIGVPDLSGMRPQSRAASLPVFRYLVGKYKRIEGFNQTGCAELSFRIRENRETTLHTVWIEPFLLHRRRKHAF